MAKEPTATTTAASPQKEPSYERPAAEHESMTSPPGDGTVAETFAGDNEQAANETAGPAANADNDTADPSSDGPADDAPPATGDDENMNTNMEDNKGTMGEGTPAGAGKKNQKRKSLAGVPEHKTKKLNRKKSVATLHLDVKPGQLWWARLKGYPPWPAVICDEEMLPEILLNNRPVTAARPDGTYRPDFQDNGKNVRERTYPIMYLHTNEFGWMVNTDLMPLDMEELKTAGPEKKSKDLWKAFEIAKTNPDLAYFKNILKEHDEAVQADNAAREERAAKKAKKDTKAKRKSKGAIADEDVDIEDVEDEGVDEEEGGKKAKPSRKRKKDVDSEGEQAKPAKTPKTKLKVTGPKTPKTPNGESAAKAKAKPKAKKAREQTPKTEEKPLTEEEKLEKKRQNVMFLRHKLQKGFLQRDKEPKPEEMKEMAEMFKNLETYSELEVSIIRATKINKVLKGILKLPFIPNDDEFSIKSRSNDLLLVWNKALASETEEPSAEGEKAAAATNGTAKEKKTEEAKKDVAETEEVLDAAKNDVNEAATSKEDAQHDIGEKVEEELPANEAEDEGDLTMQDAGEDKATGAEVEEPQEDQVEDAAQENEDAGSTEEDAAA